MVKKLREHLRTHFTAAMSYTLLLFIILIMILFGFVKYINIRLISDNEADSALTASCGSALRISDDYAALRTVPLVNISRSRTLCGWLSDGSGREDCIRMLSELSSEDTDAVWCIRESDGEFITARENVSGCIRLRDLRWYGSFSTAACSERFIFLGKGLVSECDVLITVVPVTENDNIIGFLGTETSVEDVKRYFDGFTFSENCCMVLADRFGSVFYKPDARDGFPTASEIAEAAAGIFSHSVYDSALGRYIISPETEWEIIILYNRKSAFAERMRLFGNEVLFLSGLLVIMLIAVMSIVRYECREIPSISDSIAKIAAGDYECRINSRGDNEISLIANSVDDLARTLSENIRIIEDYSNLDMLTGIQNRMKMYDAIDELTDRDGMESKGGFALLITDIDNLRWINEVFGHRYGDKVLIEFASRLKDVFSRIYRFGSDEFVALVELEDGGSSCVEELIGRFRAELEEPVYIYAVKLFVKCSVGVAVYPNDGETADILLSNADVALSRAKERGKDRVNYYSSALRSSIVDKSAIAQNLTTALRNNEMYLNYQPIISTSDGSLHGFEVLIRWESDELGFVPPSRFVGIAEETGQIVDIGTWIFENACRFLKKLTEYKSDIILSINVSAVQLEKTDYIGDIKRVLSVLNVDPANIQIELTESSMLDYINKSDEIIGEITELGINIALDDFGTGYSSLSYLKNLPVHCLKVDKSFVDEISGHGKDYAITDSIIDLVHGMGIKTVAEGVETVAQYNSLVNMKCDYIQGFLMSKPMSESAAVDFLRLYDKIYKPDRVQMEETEKRLAAERMSGNAGGKR